jgi:hypothetical protein
MDYDCNEWTDGVETQVVVGGAKITFYCVPHEGLTDFTGDAVDSAIIGNTTYYFVPNFLYKLRLNGTGAPYRIRTTYGMAKEEGDSPSAGQKYIKYFNEVYTFQPAVSVSSQDAAKFFWNQTAPTSNTWRSYYNGIPSNPSSYRVHGIQSWVDDHGDDFTVGDKPKTFTSDLITVKDGGPFSQMAEKVGEDQKHLDIFLEPDGTAGISLQDIRDHMPNTHKKVTKN